MTNTTIKARSDSFALREDSRSSKTFFISFVFMPQAYPTNSGSAT